MKTKVYICIIFLSLVISSCTKQKEPIIPVEKVSAVRGVWLTNVDSDVLTSQEKIQEAITLCKKAGINTIFAVVWNKGYTLYPSKVMKETFGIPMDSLYIGRDPLAELIEAAHKENIKVFAWFEFGFAASYNANGGHLLKLKPQWAGVDNTGKLAKKNGFEWMNAFHPDVQNFILGLVKEVVTNYNVDGIQGDDRLPAMPSLAGYDKYTVNLYKKAHKGKVPPQDFKDSAWVQWRADILNEFMERIYTEVKAIKPNVIVSMAPSIYPWAKEEYLQDWPTWVKNGWVELVCPQIYRYDIKAYTAALQEILDGQIDSSNNHIFYPGVLLKVGKYQPDSTFLLQMISANRKAGISGEVFFFYEGIKKYPSLFAEKIYNEQPEFPNLLHKVK